ncbi:MAG: ATP-binding cassette domain-containing protein [Vulcanimicrobiaceae bacterium]
MTAQALSVRRGRFALAVDEFAADAGGTALLGRNGAGKSTLLLALQGLIPYRGAVERPVRSAGVFAQPTVLHGSVLWNVSVILRSTNALTMEAAREQARTVLSRVGLSDVLSLDARKLSSGQRQRLALARALGLEPQTLFLDEPFANVDADGRAPLRNLVREYVARSGCALVLATQSLADVMALCETSMLLEDGRPVERLKSSTIASSSQPYLRALVRE